MQTCRDGRGLVRFLISAPIDIHAYECFVATITDIYRFEPRPRFASHILPPFHGLAFWAHVLVPLFGGAEVALFAPTVKVSEYIH